jgi:hypothetical protein
MQKVCSQSPGVLTKLSDILRAVKIQKKNKKQGGDTVGGHFHLFIITPQCSGNAQGKQDKCAGAGQSWGCVR